jgi:cephalosporin hydroxylase
MPMDMRTDKLTAEQWATVDHFHELIYNHSMQTMWMGWPVLKWPGDLLNYQDVLWTIQPETLIECGTALGGSALFFASMMDLIGKGHVISIDLLNDVEKIYHWIYGHDQPEGLGDERPEHARITYLTGDTTAASTIRQLKRLVRGTTMVVLDSDHAANHVLRECRLYAPFVTVGSLLVVEDININGHPLTDGHDEPGPYEATFAFLQCNQHFKWDVGITERFLMSYNAWLIRQD